MNGNVIKSDFDEISQAMSKALNLGSSISGSSERISSMTAGLDKSVWEGTAFTQYQAKIELLAARINDEATQLLGILKTIYKSAEQQNQSSNYLAEVIDRGSGVYYGGRCV